MGSSSMTAARLQVNDGLGNRVVMLDKPVVAIGRRGENDVRLVGSESRATTRRSPLPTAPTSCAIKGRGTERFVNGEQVSERPLQHGDRIQFGRASGTDVVFLIEDSPPPSSDKLHQTSVGDIRQLAALLEGLRALGSRPRPGRSAGAGARRGDRRHGGRARLHHAGQRRGELEFKLARAEGKITMPGSRFETSRKIPEDVFATGELKIVADLLDGDLANVHMGTVALGIRHVMCAPLQAHPLPRPRGRWRASAKMIGVLYLDSREKGAILSPHTRTALETLATEAASRSKTRGSTARRLEKARIEQELKIAAEIQRSLLPPGRHDGAVFEAMGASIPCRSIGGDFFDYSDMLDGSFGFALGDVAGKGPRRRSSRPRSGAVHGSIGRGNARQHNPPRQYGPGAPRHRGEVRHDVPCHAAARRNADLLQRWPQPANRVRLRRSPATGDGRHAGRLLRARAVQKMSKSSLRVARWS